MNPKFTRTLVVLGTAAALAAPAAATAKKGGKADRPERGAHSDHSQRGAKGPKFKTVIVKGVVDAVDGSTVGVTVQKGNRRGRDYVGQQLQLDVTDARVSVDDVNVDGFHDIADVLPGDRFVAQVRVERGSTLDPAEAIATRRFVDKGQPELAEDEVAVQPEGDQS